MFFGQVVDFLKDILFPVFCVECGSEGEWWCSDCRRSKIKIRKNKADGFLNGSSAFFDDGEGSPGYKLIKQFKYSFATDISTVWEDIMEIEPLLADWPKDISLIPVPLHQYRLRERGFNQAELLADILYKKMMATGRTVVLNRKGLIRVRSTTQQVQLGRSERLENMVKAFAWGGGVAPTNVILVDDVYTTGATMQECAKVLRQNGTQWIWAFTLARGV